MGVDVEKFVREYLPGVAHLSLGTAGADGRPWVCEVHFAFDDDLNIYIRSTPARRHSMNIAVNPRVSGNIVKQVSMGQPCGGEVCFEGTAEQLKYGTPEFDKASKTFDARQSIGEAKIEESRDPEGNQFYKISVDNFAIFGNFEDTGFAKHELAWPNE